MAPRLIIQRRFDQTRESVRNGPESLSGIKRNRCPDCSGTGVRNAPEYADVPFPNIERLSGSLLIGYLPGMDEIGLREAMAPIGDGWGCSSPIVERGSFHLPATWEERGNLDSGS